MAGLIPAPDGGFVFQRAGKPDVAVRHNPHWKSRADRDMRALAPFLKQIDRHIATARAALAAEYGPLWRDAWRLEDEPVLTDAEFGDRIRFVDVGYPDAQYGAPCASLQFDDDGMLRGHALFVTLWLNDGSVRKTEMFG